MLVADVVKSLRTLVHGTQFAEMSALSEDYVAGSESVKLRWPKANMRPGSTLSFGLNTVQVMAVNGDGTALTVMSSTDGSPDIDVLAGEPVLVNPPFTNWACVNEIQSVIDGMSSPSTGLYMPWLIEAEYVDHVSGMYEVPTDDTDLSPIRLLRAEWRPSGRTTWIRFADVRYQPEQRAIRVFIDPPGVATYRFTLAMPFGTIESLSDNLDDLGVTANLLDVVRYGAASVLVMGLEGRRVQPIAAGDSRRASEVSVGSNAGLSRQWRLLQQQAINDEAARLVAAYGYQQSVAAPGQTGAWAVRR